MTYPAEREPDDERFGPHHYLYPLYALLLACYTARVHAPILVGGVLLGLVGWFHFWKWYPVTGATLAGVGLLVATIGVYPIAHSPLHALAYLTPIAWAADDWLSHALGVPTPLDYIFNEYLAQFLT